MSLLPNSWCTTPLSTVADVVRGVTYKKTDARPDPADGYLPILRATNIDNGLLLDSEMVFVPERYVRPEQRMQRGDILVAASSGSASVVGKSAQLRHEWRGGFGAFCSVIRPSQELAPGYLAHFIASPDVRGAWRELAQGTNINNLKASNIGATEVPIAPGEEQGRIVEAIEEVFSRLDAGVAALESATLKLKRVRASVLQLTAPGREATATVTIDDTIRVVDYRGRTPPFAGTGIPHLRSFNVKNGKVNWERCVYVTQETYDRYMSRGFPEPGDLLFTTEAPMGEVAFAPEDKFCMAQRMMLLKPDRRVWSPHYLMYHLWSPWFQSQLRLHATGTTVQGISSRNFRPLTLAAPSLEVQERLAGLIEERLDAIDAAEGALTVQARRVPRLRAGVLAGAFSGQMVPHDGTDEPASILLERIGRATAAKGGRTNRASRRKTAA
jgi:type I restriction enzyme S subunit